jgi:hypothetical protein
MNHKDQMIHLVWLAVGNLGEAVETAMNDARLERGRRIGAAASGDGGRQLDLAPVVQRTQRGRGRGEVHHYLGKREKKLKHQ